MLSRSCAIPVAVVASDFNCDQHYVLNPAGFSFSSRAVACHVKKLKINPICLFEIEYLSTCLSAFTVFGWFIF